MAAGGGGSVAPGPESGCNQVFCIWKGTIHVSCGGVVPHVIASLCLVCGGIQVKVPHNIPKTVGLVWLPEDWYP